MERRELLKMIAVLTGAAFVGGDVFISGCKTQDKQKTFFTTDEIALLDDVGETIIPATDTPGAKAAQVGALMSVMVADCYTKDQQKAFKQGLASLNENCEKATGKSFVEASPEQRHQFLLSLEKEASTFNKDANEKERPLKEKYTQNGQMYEFVPTPKHYYTMMKQLTLLGFFTSKTGMTETLRHIPVPGRYDGDAAYTKADKAWAE